MSSFNNYAATHYLLHQTALTCCDELHLMPIKKVFFPKIFGYLSLILLIYTIEIWRRHNLWKFDINMQQKTGFISNIISIVFMWSLPCQLLFYIKLWKKIPQYSLVWLFWNNYAAKIKFYIKPNFLRFYVLTFNVNFWFFCIKVVLDMTKLFSNSLWLHILDSFKIIMEQK